MKFALLTPGKSLVDTWRGGDYDHVVAVTSAIHAEPACDIWCVAENPAHKHQGRYRLFAERFFQIKPTIWTLGSLAVRWHHLWDVPQDYPIVEKGMQQLMASLGWPMKHKWSEHMPNGHSFFRALFGALDAGAKEIHIYGHDMAGHADYNPSTGEEIKSKKLNDREWDIRWKKEKALWEQIRASLLEQQILLEDRSAHEMMECRNSQESPTGTSSRQDHRLSASGTGTSLTARRLRSIERSEIETRRMLTYGLAGTTPSDSSTDSESTPTSTLPSSFGLVQKGSKSSSTQPGE